MCLFPPVCARRFGDQNFRTWGNEHISKRKEPRAGRGIGARKCGIAMAATLRVCRENPKSRLDAIENSYRYGTVDRSSVRFTPKVGHSLTKISARGNLLAVLTLIGA
jgi:hypothetical protein